MKASGPRDFRPINAKIETVATSRFFETAFERSRVILPADGYYEWAVINPKTKQPHYIHQPVASGLAMAGVLSVWADHSKDEDDPERWILSTAIITRDAHLAPGEVHDRMPALLTPDGYDAWLHPASGSSQLLELLEHESRAAAQPLDHYEVSRDVNSVRNDAGYLIAPMPASAQ